MSAEENRGLEWFECRTAKKLPGLSVLPFWNTLLFQASRNEAAVLHSVLTLSSVHMGEILNGKSRRQRPGFLDEVDKFMLLNYNKAIDQLQPHFSSKDRPSVRVALISCVVFVCFEFLRGHFQTAQTHLENGLRILGELHSSASKVDGVVIILKPSCEPVDDWIVEAFSRLHVQVMLFRQSYQYPCFILKRPGPECPILIFRSFNEAWKELERLLHEIFHLGQRTRKQIVPRFLTPKPSPTLLNIHQMIKTELAQWLSAYEVSKQYLKYPFNQEYEEVAFLLLTKYHTMGIIMADTCLSPDDETIFDSYTENFRFLVNQSRVNWESRASGPGYLAPGQHMDMSRSVIDIGWIPPLYFTALKCRVRQVRLQAVSLIEYSAHREGIWDSKIAACVARKVIEIEERDLYNDTALTNASGSYESTVSLLPLAYRIREIEVVLPDGHRDSVLLSYKEKQPDDEWKAFTKEFNLTRQCWIDT